MASSQFPPGDLHYPREIEVYANAFEIATVGLGVWSAFAYYMSDLDGGLGLPDGTVERFIELLKEAPIGFPTSVLVGQSLGLSQSVVGQLIRGQANETLLFASLAQILLGHCWELMLPRIRQLGRPLHPTLNFYRHVRNGCFHGNTFSFGRGEPRDSEWRGKVLTSDLNGRVVFRETHPT